MCPAPRVRAWWGYAEGGPNWLPASGPAGIVAPGPPPGPAVGPPGTRRAAGNAGGRAGRVVLAHALGVGARLRDDALDERAHERGHPRRQAAEDVGDGAVLAGDRVIGDLQAGLALGGHVGVGDQRGERCRRRGLTVDAGLDGLGDAALVGGGDVLADQCLAGGLCLVVAVL